MNRNTWLALALVLPTTAAGGPESDPLRGDVQLQMPSIATPASLDALFAEHGLPEPPAWAAGCTGGSLPARKSDQVQLEGALIVCGAHMLGLVSADFSTQDLQLNDRTIGRGTAGVLQQVAGGRSGASTRPVADGVLAVEEVWSGGEFIGLSTGTEQRDHAVNLTCWGMEGASTRAAFCDRAVRDLLSVPTRSRFVRRLGGARRLIEGKALPAFFASKGTPQPIGRIARVDSGDVQVTVTAASLGDSASARAFLDGVALDATAIASCAARHVDHIPRWEATVELEISGGPGPELHTSHTYDNAFLMRCFSEVGGFGLSGPASEQIPAFRLDLTLAAQRTAL